MKIALIGLGKMGQTIQEIAPLRGIFLTNKLEEADVCIEFTKPTSVIENIQRCAKLKKNIVVGTTGWYQDFNKAVEIANSAGIGLLYGANFSIGVHLFKECLKKTCALFNPFEDYAVFGEEYHHREKRDKPSGTARELTQITKQHADKLKNHPFSSVRSGTTFGTHIVAFDSGADRIEFKHHAKNRYGYASGALLAADFIDSKKGIFTFEDCIKEYLKNEKRD